MIANISGVHRAEAEAFGLTIEETKAIFLRHIGAPFSGVFCGEDGGPFALIALETVDTMRWRVRFVAAEESLRRRGLGITRFLKDFSDRIVADTGGKIEVLSSPMTEISQSWIAFMGFRLEGYDGKTGTFLKEG